MSGNGRPNGVVRAVSILVGLLTAASIIVAATAYTVNAFNEGASRADDAYALAEAAIERADRVERRNEQRYLRILEKLEEIDRHIRPFPDGGGGR